jgi:hypothetical protein
MKPSASDNPRCVPARRGFSAEPSLKVLVLRQIRRQELDGDDPVGDGVVGAPHLAHAAATEQLYQPVPSERSPLQVILPGKVWFSDTISRSDGQGGRK